MKPKCASAPTPNEQSVDVAAVTFNDSGSFASASELSVALDCITQAREKNPNGALVVLFVHGWHHNAAWKDPHFEEFRKILMSLALREAERYRTGGVPAGRRVVGIYLGWSGDPVGGIHGFIAKYVSEYVPFRNRYEVAERIGAGTAIRQALEGVIARTKASNGPESPLLLVGHSMGAMILETALEGTLRDAIAKARPSTGPSCARVEDNQGAIVFPDLIMLLNSAADSLMSASMGRLLEEKGIRKVVACGPTRFDGPLVISATSVGDTATRDWFPMVKRGRATAANTPAMLTHRLAQEARGARCSPLQIDHLATDFQQSWHCLRAPVLAKDEIQEVAVDLPQSGSPRDVCHERFKVTRASASRARTPYWILQMPATLVKDHNDIFNGRSNLWIMSLMQLSGSIVSVADKWTDVFEPEEGPCANSAQTH